MRRHDRLRAAAQSEGVVPAAVWTPHLRRLLGEWGSSAEEGTQMDGWIALNGEMYIRCIDSLYKVNHTSRDATITGKMVNHLPNKKVQSLAI